MPNPVNPPRGMRDFLPHEKARREAVLGVIRDNYRAHGFDEIETPVVEDSDRLHAGLGGDNEKLAFGILKRGLTRDDLHAAERPLDLADLGLRYDLTVPLARFYATHRAELPSVFRSIQIGSVWRAERPQRGRYRQFVQCDIDIIGEPGIRAEAELLVATLATLDALGLGTAHIRVNDRRILISLLDSFGVAVDDRERFLVTLDKHDKIGLDGVMEELRQNGTPEDAVRRFWSEFKRPMGYSVPDLLHPEVHRAIPDDADHEALGQLVELAAAVVAATGRERGVLRFDPFLVRGMGYYTGPIFEVGYPGADSSLGGGGRYDGMIGRFLGTDVPATGFSLGFERLVDLVHPPVEGGDDALALVHDPDIPLAELLAHKTEALREASRVRLVARPKNVKPLLDALAAEGFTHFAFLAPGQPGRELRPLA